MGIQHSQRPVRHRVGIDARALGSRRGGDETYIRNLVRGLASVDPDTEYTLFLGARHPDEPVPGTERMRRVVVGPAALQVRIPITLPIALARAGLDLFHADYLAPPLCPTPMVVNVHDIAYERFPQLFTPAVRRQLQVLIPLTIRKARAVLTLSDYSRRDMIRRYRVPPEKIVVAPGAADAMFRPLRDNTALLAAVRARYGTGERFILSVGNLQPRKNLKTLIAAYVRLRHAGAVQHRLVLVGKKAWLYDDTFAAARASGFEEDLIFTGYVPDDDLVALYNAADLFVYPSIFEGFGLPPIEAMACGTPVIASRTSSLPEVVAEAGLLVDPYDMESLARTMAEVLRDTGLWMHLARQGPQQAARFSWDRTARIVADVYRQFAGARRAA